MNKEDLKKQVLEAIDCNCAKIIAIGKDIFENPELGFKEVKTAALVKKTLTALDIPYQDGLAITGVKGSLQGCKKGLRVAVMGELDAVVCPLHPDADPQTGAAHSCGHNAQVAAMLGAAIGLKQSGVMNFLEGDAVFMAVPAEEYVELEYREKLRSQGKIHFFGGKQELIRLGAFDDVDMAMMIHSHGGIKERKMLLKPDSSGFVGKIVKYTGQEAHAGAAPHDGVNALNAAMMGMMGIHAQRETFQEKDRIRVHPIITKGGDMVNIVPADVRMETYVRGRSIAAVVDASAKVNRALAAGAYAVGATVEIQEIPGYLPLIQNEAISKAFAQNAASLLGSENILYGMELMGATDAGDVSSLIPTIHPSTGGYDGIAHSKDFAVCDPEMAYVVPAKVLAMTLVDLLFDSCALAKQIKAEFVPPFTKESYCAFWEDFSVTKTFCNNFTND